MFDFTSRYYRIETATYTAPDGTTTVYKRRRFLPQPESLQLLVEVAVTQGDRVDLVAARTLGPPEQFWQIGDANRTLNPLELTAEPGRTLRVPVPQPQG